MDNSRRIVGGGILLSSLDVHLKNDHLDCTVPARFFYNYQQDMTPVWAEIEPPPRLLAATQLTVSSPANLRPFEALLGGRTFRQEGESSSFFVEIHPLSDPIESAPRTRLNAVTFALLDSPITGNLIAEQRTSSLKFQCGRFDVSIA
jgi:hypothetical protein